MVMKEGNQIFHHYSVNCTAIHTNIQTANRTANHTTYLTANHTNYLIVR